MKENSVRITDKNEVLRYKVRCTKQERYKANIEFADGKFIQCTYEGVDRAYSLDDWEFLNGLSLLIHDLAQGPQK